MADGTCSTCGTQKQLPTGENANPNFARIPSCPNCQPKRFDVKAKPAVRNSDKISASDVTRAQVRQGLDERRQKREALGKCNKCGEARQLVTIQPRSDSNIQSDLTSTDVGPTKQVPACPSCDQSLFDNEPVISGSKSEADPEKVNVNNNALSIHYRETGQLHPALATIADLVEHQRRNPGSFSWHFEDEACEHGCRSYADRLSDPANARLNLSELPGILHKKAVLHIDLRTPDQRDPNSRSYTPTPMWVKETTVGRFSQPRLTRDIIEVPDYPHGTLITSNGWKVPPINNRQTIGLSTAGGFSHLPGIVPGGDKQLLPEAQAAMGATEATLQSEAHELGAHKGRKIAACPTCNPNGGQSTQSAGLHNALHDAGLHRIAVDGCPQCESANSSNVESKESRFLEQHRLGLHTDNSELFRGSGCPACQKPEEQ